MLLRSDALLAMSSHGQGHTRVLPAGWAEEPGLLGAGGLAGLQQGQPMATGVERGRNWVLEGLVEGVQPPLELELGRKALARVLVCRAGRSLPGGLSQDQCGWKQVSALRLMWPLWSHTGFYSSTILFLFASSLLQVPKGTCCYRNSGSETNGARTLGAVKAVPSLVYAHSVTLSDTFAPTWHMLQCQSGDAGVTSLF